MTYIEVFEIIWNAILSIIPQIIASLKNKQANSLNTTVPGPANHLLAKQREREILQQIQELFIEYVELLHG